MSQAIEWVYCHVNIAGEFFDYSLNRVVVIEHFCVIQPTLIGLSGRDEMTHLSKHKISCTSASSSELQNMLE